MRRRNLHTSSGGRLTWALAVSLLAHACAVGAFYVMPAGLPRDEPVQGGPPGQQVLRPIHVTLVAAPRPYRGMPPATVAEAAPPPLPPGSEPVPAKPEARPWRLTPMPMPPIVRPPIVADGPSSAAPPPAADMPAATEAAASLGSIGGEVQGGRGAASDGQAFAGSGPAAGDKPGTGFGAGTGLGGDGTRAGGPGGTTAGQPAASLARAATSVEIVDLPPPEYPPRSRRLGEEGLVVLEVEVLSDGCAGKVRVLQAPDFPRLVEAAIEAATNARFRPATRDGQPVCAVVEIAIRFRLN
ncbi:MAG: energy transducer TonB [Planctomycetota bacterium]|nr:energy transducer TonB [Planctomycetota bacterium]